MRVIAFSAAMVLLATSTGTMPASGASDPSEAGRTLPAICKNSAPMPMPMRMQMPSDQAHQDLMKGMDEMQANMMEGMKAPNIDVAFVCGMIPHHQGAIDMAKAELAHGSDPVNKRLAQDIINAQEKQIADMLEWLSEQH